MDKGTRRTDWYSVAGKDAWKDSGISAYRIWMRKDEWNTMQRHEWQRTDGTTYCEEWIKAGPPSSFDIYARSMKPVVEGAA